MIGYVNGYRAGLIALACAVAGTWTTAAAAAPDFTGIWSSYGRPGPGIGNNDPGFPLPYRPEAKAKVEAFRAIVEPTGDTPGGVCLGAGMPWSMYGSGGYPMEFIQRPEQVTIIYELHGETRRVYFGARNAPVEDRIPGRNGYSTGRWEGDTLVIETSQLVEQLDTRTPHSADATITERYTEGKAPDGRRILTAEMTMIDPTFFTAPVVARKQWVQVPNGRLLPYECAEEAWRLRVEELARKSAPRPAAATAGGR